MSDAFASVAELRARVTEAGPWFVVPADAKGVLCRGCGALIYFVRQPSEKLMPIDVLVPGGQMPRVAVPLDGKGVSHFATCTKAAVFRGTT